MTIGVVSDTHMPRFGRKLPAVLRDGFLMAGVERIVHLGDFTTPQVADWFAQLAPFDAVAGNNDPPELWERFGRKKIITCAGVRLGMIHGDGIRKTTLERAMDAFRDDRVDGILFGHSHNPYCTRTWQGVGLQSWVTDPQTTKRGVLLRDSKGWPGRHRSIAALLHRPRLATRRQR